MFAAPPRPTTSFPFFAIARDLDADYGAVLRLAEAFERLPALGILDADNTPVVLAVHQAVGAERARRAAVRAGVA